MQLARPAGNPACREVSDLSPTPSHSVTQIVPKLPAPPAALAFLLDVDGTILDIAPTPADVRVPDELRGALARLDRLTGGRSEEHTSELQSHSFISYAV